jgi:hypothetical protein
MEPAEALAQTPATLSLGGRSFIILPLHTRDMLATHYRMRALAEARDKSPLDYAAGHTHLPPAVFAVAVAEAIKIGHRAPPPPPQEVIDDQYTTLAGVRWRVYYHISRVLTDFTPEDAAKLVTEDNLFDAAGKLDKAIKLAGLDPNDPAPATGPAS